MTRTTYNGTDIPFLIAQLNDFREGAPSLDEKIRLVETIRAYSHDASAQVDRFFVEELSSLHHGLVEAQDKQNELAKLFDNLTAPPLHPAIFLGLVRTNKGEAAMVSCGNARRIVTIDEGVDRFSLAVGDEVLLNDGLNVIVEQSLHTFLRSGETASFDRRLPDGRVVLKCRDEEMIVDVAGPLHDVRFNSGDLVRWNKDAWLAFEKIERSDGANFFLEETPSQTFGEIGGLDRQIEALQRSIRMHLQHAETVRKYCLKRKGSVLLVGPPGTGKTMVARALANWLAQISPRRRSRFMNIKPGSLHSMWYSQSEANYREAFRVARAAGEQEPDVPVVMFFDEVDAIGSVRGDHLQRINDHVLTAFMCELDGLESRGNILVVAATNRHDALDPALLRPGRLGDEIVEVPRPNMKAAREIFGKHLSPEIPYALDGHGADIAATRQALIESVVSRIYVPNGDNDLATITFRDGKRRAIKAADLINGASIAKIARTAVERACAREIDLNQGGVQLSDALTAMTEEFESLGRSLTPANCHQYVSDLPQDVDVVSVEPIVRKVARRHRYLRVA